MSIAMHDSHVAGEHNPTLLRPGTLVYLWQPGAEKGVDRTLARVERTTVDNIVGVDLRDNDRAIYEVGGQVPPGVRWTWEVAAPPQRPTACGDVEIVDAIHDVAARTQLVAGQPGDALVVRLTSGDTLRGTLTKLVMGRNPWEAEWAEVVDAPEGRDAQVHVIRVAEIASITRFRRA